MAYELGLLLIRDIPNVFLFLVASRLNACRAPRPQGFHYTNIKHSQEGDQPTPRPTAYPTLSCHSVRYETRHQSWPPISSAFRDITK